MTLLEEITTYFDARGIKTYPVDSKCAYAPTKESFVAICLGGLKPEGEMHGALAVSEKTAQSLLFDQIKLYAQDKTGILYWRRQPEFDFEVVYRQNFDEFGETDNQNRYVPHLGPLRLWKGYCRLLISDKPVIPEWTPEGMEYANAT